MEFYSYFLLLRLIMPLFMLIYCSVEASSTYDEVLKSLRHPEKVIFDISKSLKSSSTRNFLETGPGHRTNSSVAEVQLSPILYLMDDSGCYIKSDISQPPCQVLNRLRDTFGFHSESFSILFPNPVQEKSSPEKLPLRPEIVSTSLSTNFIITILFSPPVASNTTTNTLSQIIPVLKSEWKDIQVGLQFGHSVHSSKNHSSNLPELLKLVNVLLLNVDIPLENFILSYSVFKRDLRSKLNEIYESFPPNISLNDKSIHAKLNFPAEEEQETELHLTEKLYRRYYYYLLQFSVFWVNEGEAEALILGGFHKTLLHETGMKGGELRDLLIIPIDEDSMIKSGGSCELKAMLDHLSLNFQSISLDQYANDEIEEIDKCVLGNFTGCLRNALESDVCNRPTIGTAPLPDIYVEYAVYPPAPHFEEELLEVKVVLEGLPWKVIELDLFANNKLTEVERTLTASRVKDGLLNLPRDVAIACRASFFVYDSSAKVSKSPPNDTQFIDSVVRQCSLLWGEAAIIVWGLHFPELEDVHNMTGTLLEVERRRQLFLKMYPGKSVLFRVSMSITMNYLLLHMDGFHCHEDYLRKNEMVEVVANFARLHNVPVKLWNMLVYSERFDGWKPIKVLPELSLKNTKFPVFVARNYPEWFLLGDIETDPCIPRTSHITVNGVPINKLYGGTTVYMGRGNGASLTLDEVETMLLIVFHKFSLIELIPSDVDELEVLLGVLSRQEFLDKLVEYGNKRGEWYLRLDFRSFTGAQNKLPHILETYGSGLELITGIHFANWNNSAEFDIDKMYLGRAGSSGGKRLGLSLEDCIDEVNNDFESFKHLRQLPKIDYLLCNIPHIVMATNDVDSGGEEVDKYLDTTLYIWKYFQRLFPNERKDILFRLNSMPSIPNIIEGDNMDPVIDSSLIAKANNDFLRFFSDVSQYAGSSKLKFFMFPAYDDPHASRFGWWSISNYSHLSSPSVYIEKEAEFLTRETWRPPEEDGVDFSENENQNIIILLIAVVGAITILLVCGMALCRMWQNNFTVLTKKEADEFRYGSAAEQGSIQEAKFDSRKFPMDFEIAKNRIILLNLIGQGHFGLVYNAKLSESESSTSVAVKIPHPGSSKESFKSMLLELKVLCFVGKHPHVLEFIGAYIKEIGRGVVYIVTELCENGSLEDYLRNLYSRLSEEGTELGIALLGPNLYELYRIGHEVGLGMEFIASRKIVHGDLSARNILLDSNCSCKIGDFGLSRKLYDYQEYMKKNDGNLALPWRWLAIESLKRLEFTTKSDVWSYGITLWEIFSLGNVPYPGLLYTSQFVESLENGYRMSVPSYSSDEIYDEMRRCWDAIPEQRPSFAELAAFFANIRSTEYTQLVTN